MNALHMLDDNAEIELNLYRGQDEEVFYRMSLRSRVRPAIKSQRDIPYGAPDIEKEMEATGGALAEHQNSVYNDWHDPSATAKAGLRAYENLCKKIEADNIII